MQYKSANAAGSRGYEVEHQSIQSYIPSTECRD